MPNGTDHAFHKRILPRTSRCREHLFDSHASNAPLEFGSINTISIPQQILRHRIPRKRFDDLLAMVKKVVLADGYVHPNEQVELDNLTEYLAPDDKEKKKRINVDSFWGYIFRDKKNGKKRPLSIPTMLDRAMQALYKLALAPAANHT